ncbi:hypothetical protein [Maribacter sp. IgM3_T14_3]|uniref:hypothetical protein n=1 Tax=Maribacter sp. IgM3_T14_3 TaxID=3415140 RepID=UPI003C6FFCCF
MKQYILIVLIGVNLLSCSNDDNSSVDDFVLYNQTFCSDPWGYGADDNELKDNINNFFEEENIVISNLRIDNNGTVELCNACTCLSGKRIILNVSPQDLDSIKKYGFEEFN